MSHTTADLRYRLIEGPTCLAPLRVVESRTVPWGSWKLTVSVLGASHAICLEKDTVHVTELLTCAPPGGPGRAVLDAGADDTASLSAATHGLRCAVRLSVRPLDDGDALRGEYAADTRLDVPFGSEGDGPQAWTRVGWLTEPGRLVVDTVHTYPEEGLAVRSESVFEEENP